MLRMPEEELEEADEEEMLDGRELLELEEMEEEEEDETLLEEADEELGEDRAANVAISLFESARL